MTERLKSGSGALVSFLFSLYLTSLVPLRSKISFTWETWPGGIFVQHNQQSVTSNHEMYMPLLIHMRDQYSRLTLISGSWRTSGKALMQLEWAESVCKRWQLRMVVGTVLSRLPLRSSSSSCSSRASLLQYVDDMVRLYQNTQQENVYSIN